MYRPLPNEFPAPGEFRVAGSSIHFRFADATAWATFHANLRNHAFELGAFRVAVQQNDGLMTAEMMRTAIRQGAEWNEPRPPLADDGSLRACGLDGREYQPKVRPFTHDDGTAGENGDFATFKAVELAELAKTARDGGRPEVAARIERSAAVMTAEVMGNEPVPDKAVAIPICADCRREIEQRRKAKLADEGYGDPKPAFWRVRSFTLRNLKEALVSADQRISFRENRNAVMDFFGPKSGGRSNRAVGSGPGGRFNRREDNRPRREWHGAELLTDTADKLDAAGYTNLADALAAAKSGELLTKSVVPSSAALAAVETILYRASSGRMVVGEARGTSSVVPARPAGRARREQLSKEDGGAPRPDRRGEKRTRRTIRVQSGAVDLAGIRS